MIKKIFTIEEIINHSKRSNNSLEVLLLADVGHQAGVVKEHIEALQENSRHHITIYSPIIKKNGWRRLFKQPEVQMKTKNGRSFDAVIIHYSLCILYEDYIPLNWREAIREYDGLKIQIIQDEYRWINKMVNEMMYLGIDGLVSSLTSKNIGLVYDHPDIKRILKISALPGYVSRNWTKQSSLPIKERNKHLIYRGRELPFWLGNVAREKTTLTNELSKRLVGKKLITDLSSKEKDRIYGDKWLDFMKSGKAVLGLEGGASIFDFNSNIESTVRSYLKENPNADYEKVHSLLLTPFEGNVIHKTITPRSFEAIATRTAQVLFPGDFRGILKPWLHYIPLERDFSNFDEVCNLLNDDDFLQKLVDRSYSDIINSGKYDISVLGKGLDAMIDILM